MTTSGETFLRHERERIFASGDSNLYLHIGYFMSWFSAVEDKLSMLLAVLTDSRNLENFQILSRGMDAKVKVERLRRLFRKNPIGPNFEALLNELYDRLIPLRNRVAHTRTIQIGNEFHFAAIDTWPRPWQKELGVTGVPSPTLNTLEFFEAGYWLNLFNDDFQQLLDSLAPQQILEIKTPRTPMRPAQNQPPRQKGPHASGGRRNRKRTRKGQPLRGK